MNNKKLLILYIDKESSCTMDTLFVSLGSVCEVAHVLREIGLRHASYPFDWITTIDTQGFLSIFREDFAHFLDRYYLKAESKNPHPLLNTYHKMELLHDGRFDDEAFDVNMADLQTKYQRRIDRFRNLRQHEGKVVFMRHAYKFSTTDHHRVYTCAENVEITDEHAIEIQARLKSYFPHLDFTLLVVNNHDEQEIMLEKQIDTNLIKIRANTDLDIKVKGRAYMRYFEESGLL